MAPSYDSAITVFSPDGHLFQVEYAQEAVKRGSSCVGVCGKSIIVLAVERKAVPKLQIQKTIRKTFKLDDHIAMAYSGLTADARIITTMARVECQSHRLSIEDAPSVEYITRYISEKKQLYTQSNGRRPFGISCLIAGIDHDLSPHLFTTDPSGVYFEFKANAIGRNSKNAVEYLEKYFTDEMMSDNTAVLIMALGALTEIVSCDSKLIEVVTITAEEPYKILDSDYVSTLLLRVQEEKKKHPPTEKIL
ncbi:hypothetical protein HZS_6317, partial [Henneguya salminicola]